MPTSVVKYANTIFALVYAYVLYYDYKLTEAYPFYPVRDVYLSKFVWLTMINLASQCVYHSVAAVLALLDVRRSAPFLVPFHFFATTLAFPVSFTVVLLFWALYHFDPNTLVRPESRIIMAIKWYNHALHTFPLVAMMVDFYIWRHTRPSRRNAFVAVAMFCLFYLILIHFYFFAFNYWAYPILADLSLAGRSLFLLFCAAFVFCAFMVGDLYNMFLHWMWRRNKRELRRKNSRKEQ